MPASPAWRRSTSSTCCVAVDARHDAIDEVRPVEACRPAPPARAGRSCATMSSRTRVGGGRGVGVQAGAAESARGAGELAVLGAEVVAPVADAVGLVDGEVADVERARASCRKRGVQQPLRRDEEQPVLRLRPSSRSMLALLVEVRLLCSAAAGCRTARRPSTWSFISEISGETTTSVPPGHSGGAW